ncbi:MAG: gamma-glutamylcyclotransferase [Confluentimicrobium sp.]|uniref:gamma-glutamylcyclotransferase family protein n=1 Tax=Actibacterium sp. TaxID=1872125 RepID=UPI000C443AE1|nr:gamma-glutamylcyclotransferase family protein [Actibacterium sp.]MBC58740.1 gamma-glutamylcyclotransferase [Actibacterium sp.]MDY6858140.1 gamma-glutamylcyclotransferase family protein [Pseudomonadota bacterium]|tara:strand:+ start:1175 stop:1735 length:561 start_codon:yes stop_codon:yes gene_type:complete
MQDPFFFGYGSLVNRATHGYARAFPARVSGWRRAWRHTVLRPLAFLTAYEAPGEEIDGLIAAVPGDDWAALDTREGAYDRHPVSGPLAHHAPHPVAVQIYAVHPRHSDHPDTRHPILLSYIDVVVQGYLREYGVEGARRFFDTTDGWDAPIRDDRAAPVYTRHQHLDDDERRFVDRQLSRLSANLI